MIGAVVGVLFSSIEVKNSTHGVIEFNYQNKKQTLELPLRIINCNKESGSRYEHLHQH